MPSHRHLFELAARGARGAFDADVQAWIGAALEAFLRNRGAIPIETCMHLPLSSVHWRLEQRNYWLVRAAEIVGNRDGEWKCAEDVAHALKVFRTRGDWVLWQRLHEAPVGTDPLRAALFGVCYFNDGRGLGQRTIYRVLTGGPTDMFTGGADSEQLEQ